MKFNFITFTKMVKKVTPPCFSSSEADPCGYQEFQTAEKLSGPECKKMNAGRRYLNENSISLVWFQGCIRKHIRTYFLASLTEELKILKLQQTPPLLQENTTMGNPKQLLSKVVPSVQTQKVLSLKWDFYSYNMPLVSPVIIFLSTFTREKS